MSKNLAKSFYRFSFLVTLVLSITWPATADPSCEQSLSLSAGESHVLSPGDAAHWLTVIAPERGLLLVEVRAAKDDTQPIVGYWGTECSTRDRALIHDRSPEHLTMEVDGFSAQIFRVALPESSNTPFEVRTALLPLGPLHKGGEDEEIIELDGLRAPPTSLCPGLDDHGDSLACASRSSHQRKFVGRFEHAGDVDTFRIDIGSKEITYGLWRLRPSIDLVGEGDLHVTLFDADGLRLGGLGAGGDFAAGAALTAGTYFLRVQNRDGQTGAYGLALGVEAW